MHQDLLLLERDPPPPLRRQTVLSDVAQQLRIAGLGIRRVELATLICERLTWKFKELQTLFVFLLRSLLQVLQEQYVDVLIIDPFPKDID